MDRSERRRKSKGDDLDATSVARAALHGRRASTPKATTARANRCGSCASPRPRCGRGADPLRLLRMTIRAG